MTMKVFLCSCADENRQTGLDIFDERMELFVPPESVDSEVVASGVREWKRKQKEIESKYTPKAIPFDRFNGSLHSILFFFFFLHFQS